MSLPPLRIFSLLTEDGVELRLERLKGGSRGPLVLAAGYAMSTRVFTLDTLPTNLADYLCRKGFDVWLLSWRSSPDLAASRTRFTLDDVARYDWPAAIEFVRERTGVQQVTCVVHCIGSQTLLMSMALGRLDGRIRSAVCLQVGLHYDMPVLRRFLSRMRLPTILDATGLRYLDASATVHNGPAYRALDTMLRAYPVSRKERCDNPTCRRAAFMWGELLNHANLSNATHERMGDLLGNAPIRPFVQMARSTLAGRIVNATGEDRYFVALEGLRVPITFIHGGDNATVGLGSTERTHELLCDEHGADRYRRHVVDGYGHMDCLIGDGAARDVFALIGEHLDRSEEGVNSHV
jgi:cholesterol oxidase